MKVQKRGQVIQMTAIINPSNKTKAASPRKAAAIHRIHHELDEMVNRLRREIWTGGALVVGTAVMVSLMAMLVIDAIFQPESVWLRCALWLPLIGIVAAVTRRFLMMPLKQECDRLAMAWTLEQKRPAIEERLTTSLQLTATPNAAKNSLIEAVAQQAQSNIAGCQEEDLRGQEVLSRTIVATVCFAAFVLSMWIWAPYLIPSLKNVMNPWSARVLPHLSATIVPGNAVVGEGGDVRIAATASHLADAVLEIVEQDAVVASHQMAIAANGSAAEFTLAGLKSDLQYRVRSGGLFSDSYQITVDPKPVMEGLRVSLTFPEYTQLAFHVINDLTEPIELIHGTRIRIDVDSTLPCAESSLTLNGTLIPCKETVAVEEAELWRHGWEFTATEGDLQRGTITLVSEAGVPGDPILFEMRILPDLPPSIIIDQPALSEIMTTSDRRIDIAYHAFDDFGCGALQLISQINGEPPAIKDVPHESLPEFTGELAIDLNQQEVTTGDQLTFWLSITDIRPDEYGGSQTAESRKIHLQIADEAAPIGQQAVQNEAQSVLADLTAALDGLNTAKQMADELQNKVGEVADAAEFPKAPADATEKAKQLQDQIREAEQALRRLTEQNELAEQRLFQPEIERIQQVADNEIAEAKKQAGLVPLSDDFAQQREAVAATKESLGDAIDKLTEVREDIDQRRQQMELAAQLDELAQQQEQLAQEQKQQNDGQENGLEAQGKQQQVADRLQDVVEQDLDARSEQFAQRADEAAELTQAAADLQQQQDALAKLDQVRSKEELDDQLLDMIAREQEQIANETRKLEQQATDVQPPAADAREQAQPDANEPNEAEQNGKPNRLADARKQMEAVPEKLRQKDLEQAEAEAQQAGERLQEAAQSKPENAASQPNGARDDKASPQEDELQRLAKQQERVRDAIQAVREDRPEEAVAKLQQQIADRTEGLRDKADELLQLPTDDPENQQAVREAREKLEQAQKETKAAEQLAKQQQKKQAGDPNQAGDPKQAAEPKQAGEPKQQNEQQKQAAKSLKEATQSLDMVCQSCKKCSSCNKPTGSSGSGSGSSKNGDASSKPGDAKPGEKSSGPASGSPNQPQSVSEKLAQAADQAHQTARAPSPERTQQLAQDLNQLADEAAQQAGYPNRNSKPQGEQANSSKPTKSSNQPGTPRPGSPTSEPQGVQGNAAAGQSEVAPTQLRGRSTSNWTQSRRKLKSNVLDNQDGRIPEEFRGVVKDYFEQLSRLESSQDNVNDTTEEQK